MALTMRQETQSAVVAAEPAKSASVRETRTSTKQ
jgi:hypothetical protein